MSATELVQLLASGGGGAVLVYVVVGFVRGWIVPGYIYRRVVQEKGDLLNAVLQSTEAAQLALKTGQLRDRDHQ